ncbi:Rho termination factor N-terminal domain-containing protein [Trichothermofontia sp.]
MPKQTPKRVAPQQAPQQVAAEVVAPVTLQESFDLTLDTLKRVRQRMQAGDREVYRAVGEFATVATATAQAAADLLEETLPLLPNAQSEQPDEPNQPKPPDHLDQCLLRDRLQAHRVLLRQEADELLCTARTDAEIDRALRLEQLLGCIEQRLGQLKPAPSTEDTEDLSKLTVKELRERAKTLGLKGTAKANKQTLIQYIQNAPTS